MEHFNLEEFLRLMGIMSDGSIISHLYALGRFWLGFFQNFWTWFFTPVTLLEVIDNLFFPINYYMAESGLPAFTFSGLFYMVNDVLTLGGTLNLLPSEFFFWEWQFVPFLWLAPPVIVAILVAKFMKLVWDTLPVL